MGVRDFDPWPGVPGGGNKQISREACKLRLVDDSLCGRDLVARVLAPTPRHGSQTEPRLQEFPVQKGRYELGCMIYIYIIFVNRGTHKMLFPCCWSFQQTSKGPETTYA